jgi:hypothetical protein
MPHRPTSSLLPYALAGIAVLPWVVTVACNGSCGGGTTPVEPPTDVLAAAELPAPPAGVGPMATLLMVQAQFTKAEGRPIPGAAKLVLLQTDGKEWYASKIEDPESNVFHKAIAWRDGILTIGAEKARVVHWTRVDGGAWIPKVIWERTWGGQFNRFRDVEFADVTGDGKEDMLLATHDQGVVAVGEEGPAMWSYHELDQAPDTFVHEIEVGDVDGDGHVEFYATPSARNRASGESQPGGVARYEYVDKSFRRNLIAQWENSHAKEILVADVDADGKQELYAVREAHTVAGPDGTPQIQDPVRIVRLAPAPEGQPWPEVVVATLQDRQCRFLIAADVDGDGVRELVAAGYRTGLYVLEPKGDGTFDPKLVDADSTGFEHATHVADLDKDGKAEIYVAADDQRGVRRYTWNGTAFDRTVIAPIPEQHITWNLQDATFQ